MQGGDVREVQEREREKEHLPVCPELQGNLASPAKIQGKDPKS